MLGSSLKRADRSQTPSSTILNTQIRKYCTMKSSLALAITILPPVLERCHCRASAAVRASDTMRVLLRALQQSVRRTGTCGDPKLQHMMELLIPRSPQHGHTVSVHCLLALAIKVNCSGFAHDTDSTEGAVTRPWWHTTGAEHIGARSPRARSCRYWVCWCQPPRIGRTATCSTGRSWFLAPSGLKCTHPPTTRNSSRLPATPS